MFERHQKFLAADSFRCLDTEQLALWRFFQEGVAIGYDCVPENVKLATLAAYLGIPTPAAHDALGDVRTMIAVAKRLLWKE